VASYDARFGITSHQCFRSDVEFRVARANQVKSGQRAALLPRPNLTVEPFQGLPPPVWKTKNDELATDPLLRHLANILNIRRDR
jgi:hypothetical protein